MPQRYPTGKMSLPVLGDSLAIVGKPYAFAAERYARYGRVFRASFLGKPTAVLLGAEAQNFVLASPEAPKLFSNRVGYSFMPPLMGSLFTMDGLSHATQRRLMAPALHSRNYDNYLERINRVIDSTIAAWPERGQRQFYDDARAMAFRISSSLILGVEVEADYRRLSALWADFQKGVLSPLRLNLPITPYGKALRAQQEIDAFFQTVIAQHQTSSQTDMLTQLLEVQRADAAEFTQTQLLEHLRTLLFAAYDTTSGALSWALVELLQHPDVLQQLLAEVHADAGDAPVMVADLRATPVLDAVVKETLRLHPAIAGILRGVNETFAFANFTIPGGWVVALIPSFTQRMPEYFTDPAQFDPARFLAPREEDKQHPYAWIGFGGGSHICIGAGVAQIEIKAILTRLLRRFTMQLTPDQDLTPEFLPTSHPKGRARITYHPH